MSGTTELQASSWGETRAGSTRYDALQRDYNESIAGRYMAHASELQSMVEAAAQAANAGDFVSAERLLREVASRQEAELGPTHPDLANTLNNLGVVCESAGRLIDAEGYYRRAYAIAASTLASDDPFFVTSRNNLHDFCEARGRPFEPGALPVAALPFEPESPPAAPLRESEPEASWTAAPLHESELEALATASSLRKSESRGSRYRIVAVALIAFALVLLVWYGPWRDSAEPSLGADTSSSASPATAPTPTPTEDAGSPSADVPSSPAALPTTARAPAPAPVEPTPALPASGPSAIAVVEARLCRSLSRSDWRCEPAERESAPGPFYFYTRLASGRDATVRHRWYHEGQLLQNVALQVGANTGAGYRTYSRQTVAAGRAGNWRVELLGSDGALLHEERFVVAGSR